MSVEDRPDVDVILASVEDPREFATIFERHYTAVFRFASAAVGADVAGEIAAEVFARAFDMRRRFRSEYRDARPWLLGVAANLIAGYHRKRAREFRAYRRAAWRGHVEISFVGDLVDRVDAQSVAQDIASALRALRSEEVEVVALYALGDLSYREISESLGIPIGTVRSRLSRARQRLRNQLPGFGEQRFEGADG